MKKIYTIVLHMGDIQVTKDCIASLEKYEKKNTKILVVNNDAVILSGKDFGDRTVDVINNKKNLGFAGGVNVGIRYALNKGIASVLLLNNDTIIKKPFLASLLVVAKSSKHVGIVGPAICFEKNGKTIYDIGGYIHTLTGRTSHKEVEKTRGEMLQHPTYITGAAILIKKEVFKKIGLFDENFFLYYEDADFCIRARKAGFQIAVDPSVIVYHLLSKTIGKVNPFAVFHQTKSAIIFGKKYMENPLQKIFHVLFILKQTTSITLKSPKSGFAGLRAFQFFIRK